MSALLQSVKGCFDQIVIVDTGSTDGSVDFLNKINEHIDNGDEGWTGLPRIQIEHFEWIHDFAAARTYSFSFLKTDYGMWLDLDDSLRNTEAFIKWRDTLMHAAHFWLATYNYAFNENGVCECTFLRERVVKLGYGFKWKYFVHEGLVKEDGGQFWTQVASSWYVDHRRTEEDRKQDHLRNIDIINKYKAQGNLPSRMKFYLGKELVENGFPKEGATPLLEALQSSDLDIHDRILAIQYAAQSAVQCKAYDQAIDLLTNGIKLKLNRAEYWCLLGDVYCAVNKLQDATLCYLSALNSQPDNMGGIIVTYSYAYSSYPKAKLCEIMIATGAYDKAEIWLNELKAINHESVPEFEQQLNRVKDLSHIRTNLIKTSDVVITCPPVGTVTDWDENSLKEKGHGGSETAAIEVAKWIRKKTMRNVKVYQPRTKYDVMESGVEYIPSAELSGYMHNIQPAAVISWRHAIRLSQARTFVWCHDLQLPGGQLSDNYDKVVALSEFHKDYLEEVSLVPRDKIIIGFNGVNPDDFPLEKPAKDPLKVIFSSSPDRGIEQAIDVVKMAREKSGLDIKLHCFYGTDNMRKGGQIEWAEKIEKKIADNNEFVIYHGMVKKKILMQHFAEAGTWLYINQFLETYCITAIEAICSHSWPIFRGIAALPFTLKEAISKGQCDMILNEATPENYHEWADKLIEVITERKWEKMDFSPEQYSWEKVADFFIKELEL